jgi:hypothetical protein
MRAARRTICLFLISGILTPLLIQSIPRAYAGSFLQTTVRLDRQKANTPTGGTVCVQTPAADNGTESTVQLTFPSDFTLNSTASNYTATTSDLLPGATAWPGIDTATSVSGKTVTFPSSGLAPNSLYCFRFSGTNTVTTGAIGAGIGTVETRSGGGSTIDSHAYAVTIRSQDQITVSATIPTDPQDFTADLSMANAGFTFPQNTEINYFLYYNSVYPYSHQIDVVAEWSRGTIEGSGVPTVDILQYVSASATNAYNNTPPVIDIVNRTIRWTITAFPANSSRQLVRFSLKTTNTYTASNQVSFRVAARTEGVGTSSAENDITAYYKHSSFLTPTPTTTQPPSQDQQTTSQPTPTVSRERPIIENITMRTIAHDQARIISNTSTPTSASIRYGTSIGNLNQRIVNAERKRTQDIVLTDLNPDTRYYFRITATDEFSQQISSDIYTFSTAISAESPTLKQNSLLLISSNLVIYSAENSTDQNTSNVIILPRRTPVQLRFGIDDPELVESIRVIARPRNTLGVTSALADTTDASVELFEVQEGIFTGSLATNLRAGYYSFVTRLNDYNGNVSENPLLHARIVDPIRVVSSDTSEPIESARVLLSRLHPKTRLFEILSSDMLPISNPAYTTPSGETEVILPEGHYRAEVSAIGYKRTTIDFTIGIGKAEVYPLIRLEKEPLTPQTIFLGYFETARDIFDDLTTFLQDIAQSNRFFDLLAALVLILFCALSVLAFSARSGVALISLPHYLLYHSLHLLHPMKPTGIFSGRIIDDNQKPLAQTAVYLYHKTSQHVLSHTMTRSDGSFTFRQLHTGSYTITAMKDGYIAVKRRIADPIEPIVLTMNTSESIITKAKQSVTFDFTQLWNATFEFLLMLTILLQLLHSLTYGFARSLPFMVLALLNIWLWLIYVRDEEVRVK